MKITALVAATVVALAAGTAYAGYKWSNGIIINATYMQGPLGGARNSADGNQRMYVEITATSTWQQGMLWITDAAGNYKYCYTSNPQMIQALASLNSDGFVYAYVEGYICTRIGATNGSQFEPKLP